MKIAIAAALVLAAGAAQAGGPVVVAEDPVVAAPAAAGTPDFDWTGFYVGVSATSGTLNDGTSDFGSSGFGLQAGYLRDLGGFVLGGELAVAKGDYGDDAPAADWDAARLKLIGGYGAGRVLPYAFVGMTRYDVNQTPAYSDTLMNYGLGARVALGAAGKVVVGLEYLVEKKDGFDDAFDFDNREVALRIDYRF